MKKSIKLKSLFFTVSFALCALCTVGVVGCKKAEQNKAAFSSSKKVIASTSWTAAFAFLAGVDDVTVIAPASLRHPPEYEITASDIQLVMQSDFFVYAGFERMIKTLGESVGNTQMLKISCNNSVENVKAESLKLASVFGTEDIANERILSYENTVKNAASQFENQGLKNAKVFCNKNQIYLAKDLGFEIAGTFGPGEVTSEQIAQAKNSGFDFIIDNVHNPVGQPLAEVAPKSKYIIWRNFPETVEKDSLEKVIKENIDAVLK
ncbi:MAG: ABC transporter substrate-binding protein [Treponema sp.]